MKSSLFPGIDWEAMEIVWIIVVVNDWSEKLDVNELIVNWKGFFSIGNQFSEYLPILCKILIQENEKMS